MLRKSYICIFITIIYLNCVIFKINLTFSYCLFSLLFEYLILRIVYRKLNNIALLKYFNEFKRLKYYFFPF